ncbi:MAG: SpoIIE family protein phosphatase [Ruminococcus sp.]|nr:SpoIIE family protein phosphatase [Ruminococcus sp.]
MKKIFGLTFGGLEQKIANLVLVTLLLVVGCVAGVFVYHSHFLRKVAAEASTEQSVMIGQISNNTMHQVVESSMVKTNALQAYIADDMFSEVKSDVLTLQSLAKGLFEHKGSFEPFPFAEPDPKNEGVLTAQVLHEEGVDIESSELLGIAAHMSDTMIAMCENSNYMSNCYIGLADGTNLCVDEHSAKKFDENGNIPAFPVRERPWYTEAAESGELCFSDVMRDTYTGDVCVTCSAPVYAYGELVGVVGIDIFLDAMEEYVEQSNASEGSICIINDEGKLIFAPEDNGAFDTSFSATSEDLRKTGSSELSSFISTALSGSTGLQLLDINGKTYYMTGSHMETVGWAVVSAIEKEITEAPANHMLDEMNKVSAASTAKYRSGAKSISRMVILLMLLVFLLGLTAALMLAKRIVKPIELMTKRMTSPDSKVFKMEDAYRTGDEIEVLAESFADISDKTEKYISEITRITAEKERMGAELDVAKQIQSDMLPRIFPPYPEREEFDIYADMLPAREVGGDFYDFFLVDDDHLAVVMADVSGKGIPAALFMVIAKTLIKNRTQAGGTPAEILRDVNEQLCEGNEADMFVTAWLAVIDLNTGEGFATNAGHENPALCHSSGNFELIKNKHSLAVAVMDGANFREHGFKLEAGDTLFIYTDGVPEASNSNDEMFGTDRMIEVLNNNRDESLNSIIDSMRSEIIKFTGEAEQFDDFTMLALRYYGKK